MGRDDDAGADADLRFEAPRRRMARRGADAGVVRSVRPAAAAIAAPHGRRQNGSDPVLRLVALVQLVQLRVLRVHPRNRRAGHRRTDDLATTVSVTRRSLGRHQKQNGRLACSDSENEPTVSKK